MDISRVEKVLNVLVFGLTHAGVAKEAVVKVVEGIRRMLALPSEGEASLKAKADFSSAVKESLDGPTVDRGSAPNPAREGRPAGSGTKSN